MDLTASFLKLAGAAPPDGRPLDGHPVRVDVIAGRATPPRDFLWRARRGERTWRAVRSEGWKLVSREDAGQRQEWLFDLKTDPGEGRDLIARELELAARLRRLLTAGEAEVQPVRGHREAGEASATHERRGCGGWAERPGTG